MYKTLHIEYDNGKTGDCREVIYIDLHEGERTASFHVAYENNVACSDESDAVYTEWFQNVDSKSEYYFDLIHGAITQILSSLCVRNPCEFLRRDDAKWMVSFKPDDFDDDKWTTHTF